MQGSVEQWLSVVEERMRGAVRSQLVAALAAYPVTARTAWVLQWPAMIVLAVSAVFWAARVEAAFAGAAGAGTARDACTQELLDLTDVVRGQLSPAARTTLGALITVDVHARDVVADLAAANVSDPSDFEWVKQLRYYWREPDLHVDMVQVRRVRTHA
jgi:dynein heavy chain, axonemal